ncbi:MAG: DsbA family protein [bacterium]
MATTRDKVLNVAIVMVFIGALAVGGMRAYQYYDAWNNDPDRVKTISDWQHYAKEGTRVGREKAAVTIVEFADFQCPFCRRAEASIARARTMHPNDIAVVYRHYPVHEHAFVAAMATECARLQGAFEDMHALLYAEADSIGQKTWDTFARQAGVKDSARFATCLRGESVYALVVRDTLAAHALRVSGTPTFLINDMRVVGFRGQAAFDSVLTRALGSVRTEYGAR